jgi:SAM-dependent methyltransferase
VLATDLETRFLQAVEGPNLEVRRHDILSDPLPEAYFDLVHTRWLLHWLPARQEAVRRMVNTLRPGGWLLAEEPDLITVYHALEPKLLRKVTTACHRLLEVIDGGMDTEYSRRLFDDLRAGGLTDLDADGRVPIMRGGMPFSSAEFLRLTIEKVRVALVDSGAVTEDEIAQAQTLLRDPSFAAVFSLTIAVWGRRPLW